MVIENLPGLSNGVTRAFHAADVDQDGDTDIIWHYDNGPIQVTSNLNDGVSGNRSFANNVALGKSQQFLCTY